MKQIDDADTRLYVEATAPMANLLEIAESFQRMRVSMRDYTCQANEQQRAKSRDQVAKLRGEISENSLVVETA